MGSEMCIRDRFVSLTSLLLNKEVSKRQSLIQSSVELREQYSFMVFKDEREKIKRQLIRNIQKQINAEPFDTSYGVS